jgi:5-methylcytosine-specific restriction endonuclease McrA
MALKKKRTEAERTHIIAEAQRERERKLKSYRERALRIFPWVCAHCGREFSGKKVRELTVHHKDHDHDNNPPDGSNWELLCIYCHDHEHSKYLEEEWHDEAPGDGEKEPPSTYRPFAGLDDLLKDKK